MNLYELKAQHINEISCNKFTVSYRYSSEIKSKTDLISIGVEDTAQIFDLLDDQKYTDPANKIGSYTMGLNVSNLK